MDMEQKIQTFILVTGASRAQASRYITRMTGDVELAINNWFAREEEPEPEPMPVGIETKDIAFRAHPLLLNQFPELTAITTLNQLSKALDGVESSCFISRWLKLDAGAYRTVGDIKSTTFVNFRGSWFTYRLEPMTEENLLEIGELTLQDIKNPMNSSIRLLCPPPGHTANRIQITVVISEKDYSRQTFEMLDTDTVQQLCQQIADQTGAYPADFSYVTYGRPKEARDLSPDTMLKDLNVPAEKWKDSIFKTNLDSKKYKSAGIGYESLGISADDTTYCRTKAPGKYNSNFKALSLDIGLFDGTRLLVGPMYCHPLCSTQILMAMISFHYCEANNPFSAMKKGELTEIDKNIRNNFSRELMLDWLQAFQSNRA